MENTRNTTDVNSVRTFITDNPSKRRFLNDRVRSSVCSLASSSHNAGRDLLRPLPGSWHPPSSLTDDCLLASTWDYAETTRHATPCRRTQTTSFKYLWRQTSLYGSRNKSQAPLSQHTATRLPDNLNLTFEPLYASKCSIIIISVSIYPNHALRSSRPLPPTLQPLSNNLREGVMWGNAHIEVLPRAPTLLELTPGTTYQPDNRQFKLVMRLGQSCISYFPFSASGLLCVQCGYWDSSVNPQNNH
jgi:hypothetical protein